MSFTIATGKAETVRRPTSSWTSRKPSMPPIGRWTLVQAACTELLVEKSVMVVLSRVGVERSRSPVPDLGAHGIPTRERGGGVTVHHEFCFFGEDRCRAT